VRIAIFVIDIISTNTLPRIKKAYRRKALELHPDRNYGDVENATTKFAEVQSAYEVLSDPQERSWYDSHRDSILRGDTGAGDEEHFEHNVRLTSTRDILGLMSKFNSSTPFTDAPTGFYGILAETFANLAREEDAACDWEGVEATDYPEFGSADDNYEDVAKPFYRVWINFSTKKSFSWKDQYRTSDAPDRATRRLVEKENKKFRDEGIREFNDAVRALVAFVRKRDPRYIPNSQTEADRQKILRDAAAAQAARSRAANQAKLNEHVVADWTKSREPEEEMFSESEEEEVEEIECVVCGKTFKSEKQYETHEKSKKHQKAVYQLQREMRKENERLNLNKNVDSSPSTPLEEDFEKLEVPSEDDLETKGSVSDPDNEGNASGTKKSVSEDKDEQVKSDKFGVEPKDSRPSPEDSDIDDEYGSREDVENRLLSSLNNPDISETTSASVSESDGVTQPKLGKAKAKRAKKAARQEAELQSEVSRRF
jgi:DnaJ family protein A protein 5